MTDYYIVTMMPSKLTLVEGLLTEAHVDYVAPKYRVIKRSGRHRLRTIELMPVMPGLIFLPVDQYHSSIEYVGEKARLRRVRNGARADGIAVVDDEGLLPMMEWIAEQEMALNARLEQIRQAKARTHRKTTEAPPPCQPRGVGSRVVIVNGPFKGVRGTVEKDDGHIAGIRIDPAGFPMQIASCNLGDECV